MSKFLVSYNIPVRHRQRTVQTESAEEAAALVNGQQGHVIEDVIVEDLENEEADDRIVYEWCVTCKLPIWSDAERETYRKVDATRYQHRLCAEE